MRNLRFFTLCILLAFSLPYTYGGCSSGGSDDSENNTGTTYTGRTDPADINESNAQEIFSGIFGAGLISESNETSSADQTPIAQRIGNFRSFRIPLVLSDSVKLIHFSSPKSSYAPSTYTISDTIDGSCGGSMSYFITVDDIAAGTFEGSLTFSKFCEHEITINGIVDISGVFDVKTPQLLEIDFFLDNLTAGVFQIGRLQFDGEISIDLATSPHVVTIDVYAKDRISGKVYYLDYRMDVYEYPDFVEIEIDGKFYFPDHGYVTITIPEPLLVHNGDIWPTSGILIITGANHASAKLTVIDHFSCTIEVDLDGDGEYDWSSEVIDWEDL